jgi:hypothetical protein
MIEATNDRLCETHQTALSDLVEAVIVKDYHRAHGIQGVVTALRQEMVIRRITDDTLAALDKACRDSMDNIVAARNLLIDWMRKHRSEDAVPGLEAVLIVLKPGEIELPDRLKARLQEGTP